MRSALQCLLLFSALWTLSLCGTRQFHVENKEMSWTDAQKYCKQYFVDLITIDSKEEMDAVKAALKGKKRNYWIGLRQKPGETNRSWIWSDGTSFSYSNWTNGEPNNPGTDNCVELLSDNGHQWNDLGCLNSNAFVCNKEVPLVLIKEEKTWREALSYCRENHTDLVSVHNQEIQSWVKIVTKKTSTDNVWIGLRHTCTLSFWFWVSGESICYQNWAPGNGTGEEDCSDGERTGAVQTGSQQWVSLPETQTLNFICTDSEEA